jgi:hypothetical protein
VQGVGVGHPGHLADHPRPLVERHDRHRVGRAQFVHERVEGVADQIQTAALGHRTGYVDDKGQRGVRSVLAVVIARLEPDAHDARVVAGIVARLRGPACAVDGNGEAVATRLRVALVE